MVFCGFTLFLLSTFKTTKLVFLIYRRDGPESFQPSFLWMHLSFGTQVSRQSISSGGETAILIPKVVFDVMNVKTIPVVTAPGPRRFQAKGRSSLLVLFGGRFRLFFCCDWTRTWRWSPWLTILYDHLMLKEEGHFRSTSLSNRE